MEPYYLKIKAPVHNDSTANPTSLWKTLLMKAVTIVVPKANPDFDDKIDKIDHWLIEFEGETPSREIGIEKEGTVTIILPWKNNYGYWTDNNLKLNDFLNSFDTTEISEQEFKEHWEIFEKLDDRDN